MLEKKGILYIVATPIGHLADISLHALEILKTVDLIAAEDTRTSKVLLSNYSIKTQMTAYHEHNEVAKSKTMLELLHKGKSIALISDAGTPLISDPGYSLVEKAHDEEIRVVPVPGACALIAALSASGIATAKFSFEGFIARASSARKALFNTYIKQQTTLIFYESSHRIVNCMEDISSVFESDRKMAIARELTKTYETIVSGTVETVTNIVESNKNMQRGEFVVLVEGYRKKKNKEESVPEEVMETLSTLMSECSLKTAVSLAVKLTGLSKRKLYQAALELEQSSKH